MSRTFAVPPRALLLAAACLPHSAVHRGGDDLVSFEELGKSFLEKHSAASAAELPLETLLSQHCVRLPLGAFELHYPLRFLEEKDHADELPRLGASLLELARLWADWVAADEEVVSAHQADFELYAKWVKGLKSSKLAKAAKKGGRDVLALAEAKPETGAALERLSALLCASEALRVLPRKGGPLTVLATPTRRDFVEHLAYLGLLDPSLRDTHCTPQTTEWTTFWLSDAFVLALQYPAWEPSPDFEKGLDMNRFDKNGLEQHAVQQVANAWQWACYGEAGSPFFHQAVAMNLAIAACGELNALEGDGWGYGTTGARTQPYERFVPGGASQGGVLPPMPAAPLDGLKEGRWRENHGSDHFVACLRRGQRDGGQELGRSRPEHLSEDVRRDKRAHFLIFAENDSDRYVVSAPFFGEASKERPYPPTEMLVDYREFFRAYKSCFMNWLRTQAVEGDAERSAEAFGALLRAKFEGAGSKPFEEVVQAVYGQPLSAADGSAESLEWRFLDWLAGGR